MGYFGFLRQYSTHEGIQLPPICLITVKAVSFQWDPGQEKDCQLVRVASKLPCPGFLILHRSKGVK